VHQKDVVNFVFKKSYNKNYKLVFGGSIIYFKVPTKKCKDGR